MEPNAQNRRYGTNIVSQPSILCVFAACLRPRPDSVPSATPRWPAFKLSKTDGSGLSLSCSSCLHGCASSARRSTDGSEDPTRQNLFALELESHALSAASFVNSALWLENPDSLGMIFRQILISRLICKRAIAVQNMGVSQRRLGALGHSRVPTGIFFFETRPQTEIFGGKARGQGDQGRLYITRIETGLTTPAYMGATCPVPLVYLKAHRTEKPVLVTLTVHRTASLRVTNQ